MLGPVMLPRVHFSDDNCGLFASPAGRLSYALTQRKERYASQAEGRGFESRFPLQFLSESANVHLPQKQRAVKLTTLCFVSRIGTDRSRQRTLAHGGVTQLPSRKESVISWPPRDVGCKRCARSRYLSCRRVPHVQPGPELLSLLRRFPGQEPCESSLTGSPAVRDGYANVAPGLRAGSG